MRHESRNDRIVSELSNLLGRRFELAPAVAPGSRQEIVAADGLPLDDAQKRLLESVAELLQRNSALRNDCAALDQRLRRVERENVELAAKNRALVEQSSRDALTGLFTRCYVIETIEAELNRALRCGSSIALLMLDVDHLKMVNEQYGTATGDAVLQSIAHVLRESCRMYDVPARYGGEEFCLLLPDATLDSTIKVAERLRKRIEATPVITREATVAVTTSIGIASLESIPDEALLGASSLLERADRALYTAKDQGRNRVETWSGVLASRSMVVALEH